jgi:hypothetical protein
MNVVNNFIASALPTIPPENPYLNSATSGGKEEYGWIVDGIVYLVRELFDVLNPFMEWGSKFIIISCVIIYYCSLDKKYIASGLKWGIIFIFWISLRGVVG